MTWFLDHIWGITLAVILTLFFVPVFLCAAVFYTMRDIDLDDFDSYFEGD